MPGMLVLSRQRDQTIMVGDETTVHVSLTPAHRQALDRAVRAGGIEPALGELALALLGATPGPVKTVVVDIRGEKVRLGIIAPKELAVHREEVYAAIQRERSKPEAPKPEAPCPK